MNMKDSILLWKITATHDTNQRTIWTKNVMLALKIIIFPLDSVIENDKDFDQENDSPIFGNSESFSIESGSLV